MAYPHWSPPLVSARKQQTSLGYRAFSSWRACKRCFNERTCSPFNDSPPISCCSPFFGARATSLAFATWLNSSRSAGSRSTRRPSRYRRSVSRRWLLTACALGVAASKVLAPRKTIAPVRSVGQSCRPCPESFRFGSPNFAGVSRTESRSAPDSRFGAASLSE